MSREKQIEEMAEIEKAAEWFENRAKTTPMQGARRMFELAGEALREKANGVTVQKWISVEERLPKPTYCVLVYGDEGEMEIDALGYDGEWMGYVDVTHWMPLPEPPKKGGAE